MSIHEPESGTSSSRGHQPIISPKCSQKLYENKTIWKERGAHVPSAPLSANDDVPSMTGVFYNMKAHGSSLSLKGNNPDDLKILLNMEFLWLIFGAWNILNVAFILPCLRNRPVISFTEIYS